MKYVVAFAAFALTLSMTGCAANSADAASSTSSDVTTDPIKHEVTANSSDKDATVRVTESDTFVLELDANASTGYEWKVTKTDRSFAYPFASDYLAPDTDRVGSGGTQVFKWSTDPVSDATGAPLISKVGKHQLTLEYRRPGEPASTPATQSYSLTVEIVAKSTDHGGGSLCGDHSCGAGASCQWCWGIPACVPNGAKC